MNTRKPPLESRVKKRVLEALKERGGFWYKTHGSPMVKRGLPDIIGCYRMRFIAFEVKRDKKKKPTKLQAYRISEITRAGGIARVISTVEEALRLLDRIDELQEARARNRNS